MDALTVIGLALGCLAAVEDVRRGVISNWLNLSALLAGLICHFVAEGWPGLARSCAGAAVGFAVFFVPYWMGGLGGGDVKLMAAFGALLGPLGILTAAVLTSGIGGLIAAASWLLRRDRRIAIRYGPAIVLGSWLALLAGR